MIDWYQIIEEHAAVVWRTAYRLLGRTEETKDCLQDTFMSALQVCRNQRVRNWGGLLRHLATARALDRLRARARREQRRDPHADPDTVASTGAGPAEVAEAEELMSRLRSAMARLPGRQSEVFSLHFLEQISHREIAAVLGLSTNTVSVSLHQAREKLRALLLPKENGGRKP